MAGLAPLSAKNANRRLSSRVAAMRDGQAFRPDGLSLTLLIVDLSDGGARVRMRGGRAPPEDFVLVDPVTWLAHRVEVVWRKDAEVGLRILKSQSLRGVIPGALQPARAFCESATR